MEQGLGEAWVEQMLALAEQAGLRENSGLLTRIRRVALCGSAEAGHVLRQHLWRLAVPHMVEGNPFFPPPTKEQLSGGGGFPFGACWFSAVPHRLQTCGQAYNMLVSGTPGCGKTTVLCHLAEGARRSGAVVHFDLPRADCRILAKYRRFRLAIPGPYRWNIIGHIRNVPRHVQHQSFAEVTSHHFDLRTRGKLATARWLAELDGEFAKTGHEPCVADFAIFLERKTLPAGSYEREAAARIVERLQSCVAYTGQMLVCERGQPVLEMGDPILFEMSGVDPQVRDYLTELRLRHAFLYRQYNPEAGSRQLVQLLDETMNLGRERRFSSSSREMSTASMDLTVTQTRYFNISVCFATQVVVNLSSAIKGTSALKLAGTTVADQVYETARLWGLDKEQAEWLTKLPRGSFVVRRSGERLPRAYLLRFPPFRGLDEQIGEAEALELAQRTMGDLPWKSRWTGYEEPARGGTRANSPLDIVEQVFRRIAERPDETCAERCAAIGIDAATESAARRDLSCDGGRALIQHGPKVGNRIFAQLTAKGRAAAEEKQYDVWRSHASAAHSWLVRQCLRGLRRVGRVSVLDRTLAINGRRPDGAVRVDDTCVVIQVCSSDGNYEREARALLELAEGPGVDLAVLVATHKRRARGITKALRGIIGDVGWERIAVLDATQVLAPNFNWGEVLGGT